MLLGQRYYGPSVGRFMILDPIKRGRNWYGYVGDRPVVRVDRAGLTWEDINDGSCLSYVLKDL